MIGALNTVSIAISSSLDQEVADWYTNVQNDGGQANPQTLGALNKFIQTLKANKIRNKIRRCNLFCGSSIRSAVYPIIKSAKEGGATIGNRRDINRGFSNADYTNANGLWANSTILQTTAQKYLNTEAHITELGIDGSRGHLSFMSSTSDNPIKVSSVGGYIMPLCGGDKQAAFDLSAFIEFDGTERSIKGASASSAAPSEEGHAELLLDSEEDFSGLWVASRDSATSQKIYLGNNTTVTSVGTASNNSDQSLFPIGGYKFRIFGSTPSGGEVIQTSAYKLLFYSIGDTLTQSEITILNDALIDFNKTLGRI